MKVQLTLTPAEGKRLIARAVANMEVVQHAYRNGVIIISTSTSTAYVAEELMGEEIPDKGMFTAGVVTYEGAGITTPEGRYPHYVLENGELTKCTTPELVPYLTRMGSEDVFLKGANAIDPFGNAGILLYGPGGGTIGTAYGYIIRNGITFILPVGLEKLVPVDLRDVSGEMGANVIDIAMGWPSGLMAVNGEIITELEAFEALFDVEATPIGGGGIHGGEGCKIYLIEGDDEDAEEAYAYVMRIKGEPKLETHTMEKPDHLA